MKGKYFLFIFLGFIFFMGLASACFSFPSFESKNNNVTYTSYGLADNQGIAIFYCNNSAFLDYRNESIILGQLNDVKSGCGFSDEDISIIKDYIVNGYSVKEQTDEEYAVFLEQARNENANCPSNCLNYKALTHIGKWTGYSYDANCDLDKKECITVKTACGGVTPNIIWNDLIPVVDNDNNISISQEIVLFVIAVLLILVIIYLLLKLIRKSK